jgi:hypothetical protein
MNEHTIVREIAQFNLLRYLKGINGRYLRDVNARTHIYNTLVKRIHTTLNCDVRFVIKMCVTISITIPYRVNLWYLFSASCLVTDLI